MLDYCRTQCQGPGLITDAATPIVRWGVSQCARQRKSQLLWREWRSLMWSYGDSVARSAGSRTIIKNLKLIYAVDFNCISSWRALWSSSNDNGPGKHMRNHSIIRTGGEGLGANHKTGSRAWYKDCVTSELALWKTPARRIGATRSLPSKAARGSSLLCIFWYPIATASGASFPILSRPSQLVNKLLIKQVKYRMSAPDMWTKKKNDRSLAMWRGPGTNWSWRKRFWHVIRA